MSSHGDKSEMARLISVVDYPLQIIEPCEGFKKLNGLAVYVEFVWISCEVPAFFA